MLSHSLFSTSHQLQGKVSQNHHMYTVHIYIYIYIHIYTQYFGQGNIYIYIYIYIHIYTVFYAGNSFNIRSYAAYIYIYIRFWLTLPTSASPQTRMAHERAGVLDPNTPPQPLLSTSHFISHYCQYNVGEARGAYLKGRHNYYPGSNEQVRVSTKVAIDKPRLCSS